MLTRFNNRNSLRGSTLAGLFFIVLGSFWVTAVYHRCQVISPTNIPSLISVIPDESPAPSGRRVVHYRTPYAQPWHMVMFWVIAALEIGVGLGYALAGLALARLYHWRRQAGMMIIFGDLFYKALVAIYQSAAAIPLQTVTKNKNILISYYLPDSGIFSRVSYYLSGLEFTDPGGWMFWSFYTVYVLAALKFFWNMKGREAA